MSSNPIIMARQRIAEKRARKAANNTRIAALHQENEKEDLGLAAWEEVLRDLMSVMPDVELTDDNVASVIATLPKLNGIAVAESSDRRRGPKGMWKLIMPRMIAKYRGADFALSDVQDAGAALTGMSVNLNTARSQMWHYVKDGHIERSGSGRYRFTRTGLDVFASLSNAPDAQGHLDAEASAVDDVQAAGVLSGGVESADPKASSDDAGTQDSESR